MEYNIGASWLKAFHHHGSAGQSSVAAKRNFGRGSKPSQAIVVAFTNKECSLGQIVFGGNRLQDRITQTSLHWNNRCGVSRESAGGEGVNLKNRSAHCGRSFEKSDLQ